MKDRVACRSCQSRACELFRLQHTAVYRCSAPGCGLRFAEPQLDDETLKVAYRNHYYPGGSGNGQPLYEATSLPILLQVLEHLSSQLGSLQGRRFLDFGCGNGDLSRAASQFGVVPTGIEFDSVAREMAGQRAGMPVYPDLDSLERENPGAQFDLVALWEVIEHLREPWRDLAHLRRLMTPGAMLFLSTPNAACLKARFQGPRWSNYLNPTHFYYFTRTTLQRVMERAGFIDVRDCLLSIQYPRHGALRRWMHDWLVRARLHGALLFLALNPGDSPPAEVSAKTKGRDAHIDRT